MGTYNAGSVELGLRVNKKEYDRQINGIQKIATKTAKVMAGAFTVKAAVNFGKQCLELGSDLQEVQNVVDTVFPNMEKKVNKFAQNAIASYGLSETMAKRYTGTFGAMADAFGFAEKESYNMASALTGLAGDVASFYNITQDEAYTKLKSVFTGETETLKDLGVVMTQNALDAYAMANGYGKVTSAMTEAEKVALRFAFVQEKLSNASGDFAKTSGSWANQTRLLSLQFQSLQAAIGQGLINVLTPVIQWLNALIGKLVSAANAFKKFTETLTGKKSQPITLKESRDSIQSVASGADNASTALGKTAKKVKALKRELAGFDQINKVSDNSSADSGSSGPGGGTSAGTTIEETPIADSPETVQKLTEKYKNLGKAVDKLKKSFKAFTDLLSSAGKWTYKNVLVPLGKWTMDKLLPKIIELLASAFDVLTEALKAVAPIFQTVWNVFFKPIAKFTGKAIIAFLGAFTKALNGLAQFVEKNPTLFQGIVTSILGLMGISKVAGVVNKFRVSLKNAGTVVGMLTNSFPKLAGKAKAAGAILKLIFAPKSLIVLGIMAAVTAGIALYKNWDKIKKIAKKVSKQILKPFKSIADFFKNAWRSALKAGIGAIEDMRNRINGIVDGLELYFGGFVKFISGIFLGDWEKAWNGVKDIFDGIWNTITAALDLPDIDIKAKISAWFADKKKDLSDKWDDLTENIKDKTAEMKAVVKQKWADIKAQWNNIVNNIKNKTAQMKANVATKKATIQSAWKKLAAQWKNKVATFSLKFSAAAGDLKKWVNKNVIDKVNSKFKKVPILKNHLIPRLAEGGYVKKNTPQLAMIGDNRHQGEVVSPEGKLLEMAKTAAAMAGGGVSPEVIALLKEILTAINALKLDVYLDGKVLKKRIVELINANTRATGVCEIDV